MLRALQHSKEAAAADTERTVECASVLDEMLCELEVWDAENAWRSHQREIREKEALIELLEVKVTELDAMRIEGEAQRSQRATSAKTLRESLVAELWTLSKTLKSTHALEKKLERAEASLGKIPRLERQLELSQRDVKQLRASAEAQALAAGIDPVALIGKAGVAANSADSTTNAAADAAAVGGPAAVGPGGGGPGGGVAASNAPVVTEPSAEVVAWVQKALGGKKWRKQAHAYALTLANAQCGAGTVDGVIRLNVTQLHVEGRMAGGHALLVSCHPRPGSPLDCYAAPFMVLEDKVLLKAFSFLHASSVLSAAQACRPFFTRVDTLFGMGSTLNQNLEPIAPALAATTNAGSSSSGADAAAPSVSDAPASSAASSVSASSVVLTAASKWKVKSGLIGSSLASSSTSAESTAVSSAAHPLGHLAKKIAAKLNSSEMKGIMQMTERIRRLEATVGHLTEVKEDSESRLQATESVKDFLVEKLKDTELVLKKTIDASNESARQHQADQEVIHFLDGRVQECEKQLRASKLAGEATQTRVEGQARDSAAKTKQLEEMLEWAREQAAKKEKEWKGHKKLLAKEVKSLRVGVATMTNDRDAYQRQANALANR